MTPAFLLHHQYLPGVCVLALAGELDRTNSGELTAYLKQARRPGDHVVADLAELSFMDSSGLHILLDCHRTCLAEGASRHLAAAYGVPARVLEVGDKRIFSAAAGFA
ncbi:STAS domain-containing protein [Nonomuraea sp. KM90]|uniref:STAS domain-containing protein n=1 Tax=Nonomuraea sp. KM90 TaxID=3457428 RepID=UPI003FCE9977